MIIFSSLSISQDGFPGLTKNANKDNKIIPCGIEARQLLINKISDNKVKCKREGKDQYKRTLAECFVNNLSLSSYLVRKGYAFAYACAYDYAYDIANAYAYITDQVYSWLGRDKYKIAVFEPSLTRDASQFKYVSRGGQI